MTVGELKDELKDIPDEIYDTFKRGIWSSTYDGKKIRDIVMNGKPLPKVKWLYRLEAKDKNNGLWYNSNNEYVWGCKNCKGEAKNLPMGYDERYHIDGKNWFSSCSNKDDLLHWYSKEDARYLIDNGFVFTRYLAVDYHEFELETVFLKETALAREEISFAELF